MPPKEETQIKGRLYYNGKQIMSGCNLETVTEVACKPVGDLHSVPHYRCGNCHCAVVIFEDDKKPDKCKWCGVSIDWNE